MLMVLHCMHRPDSIKGEQAAQHQLLLVDKFNRRISHNRQYENLLPTQAGAPATPSSPAAAGGWQTKLCSVGGCPNIVHARGFCNTHSRKPCSVDGCTTKAVAWGVCSKHGASPQYPQQPRHLQQHPQQGLPDIVQCMTCGRKYNRHGTSQHAKWGRCTRKIHPSKMLRDMETKGKWGE